MLFYSIQYIGMAQGVISRFNKQEYYNFLKVGKALKCTAEGLSDYAEKVIKTFHTSLLQQHGKPLCQGPRIIYDKNSQNWRINCTCGVCKSWWLNIKKQHADPDQICWENTNVKNWPVATQSWQLAKPFMSAGKANSCNSPADTDPAGILQLLIYFKEFAAQGLNVQQVKDVSHCIFLTT